MRGYSDFYEASPSDEGLLAETQALSQSVDHIKAVVNMQQSHARGSGVLEQGGPRWDRRFLTDEAKALLTGVAAHNITSLPSLAGAGTSLLLASLAHADGGWAIPVGGSQAITNAMVRDLEAHGGTARLEEREGWSTCFVLTFPARLVLLPRTEMMG